MVFMLRIYLYDIIYLFIRLQNFNITKFMNLIINKDKKLYDFQSNFYYFHKILVK